MTRFLAFLIIVLTGCWTRSYTVPPRMTTSQSQVKVGESFEVTITYLGGEFRGNPDLTYIAKAFIYSPKNTPLLLAPYGPLSTGGFDPETLPEFFPLSPTVEVVTPISPNPSVPELQVTTIVQDKT